MAGANAFVIKGQIPTIAATVPPHIPGEYLLEDEKRRLEEQHLLNFSKMENYTD